MIEHDTATCLLEPPSDQLEKTTGLTGPDAHHVPGFEPRFRGQFRGRGPLSTAWISDELLDETIELWSQSYGRPISEDEAMEILMNVKRLCELMLKRRKEDHP